MQNKAKLLRPEAESLIPHLCTGITAPLISSLHTHNYVHLLRQFLRWPFNMHIGTLSVAAEQAGNSNKLATPQILRVIRALTTNSESNAGIALIPFLCLVQHCHFIPFNYVLGGPCMLCDSLTFPSSASCMHPHVPSSLSQIYVLSPQCALSIATYVWKSTRLYCQFL